MSDFDKLMGLDELVENPTARVPVCLCLDTSGSMSTVEGGNFVRTGRTEVIDGKTYNIVEGDCITRIQELQKGIDLFVEAIRDDEVAVYSAEICIVTFDSEARCVMDFSSVENIDEVPRLECKGNTSLGEGVNLALDLLEERKQKYRDAGVDYYQPWLVLMTDGEPNGNESVLENAINRTVSMIQNKKLTIFPIGIGKEADMSTLNKFSPNRPALRLQGLKFSEFFDWLSKSVSRTSQSIPGETVKLDLEGIMGWGEL